MRSVSQRPNIYAMAALKRAYGERLGRANDLLADRFRLITELHHLAAVMRMLDPNVELAAIRPIRPYKPRRSRWSRTALKILREANEPMRGRDLARRVMSERGIDPNDFRTMVSIECSMQAVLLRLARRGLVVMSGKPRRWAIAR
jgi:hypothetical protein